MQDHYYETKMTMSDGAEVPARRFHTLMGAWAQLDSVEGAHGSIWYQGESEDAPVECVRFNEDGTVVDVLLDDGSNYPLGGTTEFIEPGAMTFSLWFETDDGERVPYDFGFDWDGEHSGDFQCWRGDDRVPGSPLCKGKITWSNRYNFYNEVDEDEFDDLGDDLQIAYTSSSPTGAVSGQAVLEGAAVIDSTNRDGWVKAARDLFAYLKGQELV